MSEATQSDTKLTVESVQHAFFTAELLTHNRNTSMRGQMCSTAVMQMCSMLDWQGWGSKPSRTIIASYNYQQQHAARCRLITGMMIGKIIAF